MKSNLRKVAAAMLPALALSTAAVSFEARADEAVPYTTISVADEPLAAFVGQPAYEENGTFIGFIHEVVVEDPAANSPVVAVVTKESGETVSMPLGHADAIAAIVAARAIAPGEATVPEYITPESPGS